MEHGKSTSSGNARYLVNCGWRYRRGMPINISIAESAVDEVVRALREKMADALYQ
ncbi:hypothetical protein ACFQUU_28345 [Herbaspirillum sp. GCM10030257]|uniref:hypothetical protein n=1 Tax=Herbaspirillum sp. GCM10030257 TaxID=3273393 RepID=UPI00361C2E1D